MHEFQWLILWLCASGVGILKLFGICEGDFEMNCVDDGKFGFSADGDGCDG